MMRDVNGERLWHRLPGLVPQSEWEVAFQDMHRHIEGLIRRVHRLEDGGGHAKNQLAQLSRKCHAELATERQLAAAASRIDMDVAGHQQHVAKGLEELQAFAKSQVAALRAEVMREVGLLRGDLRAARKEIHGVHLACLDSEARAAAAYVTKAEHEEITHALKCEHAEACQALQASVADLREDRASKSDLEGVCSALKSAHGVLQEEHGQTVQGLEKACAALAKLEGQAREELAGAVMVLQESLATLDQKLGAAAEERATLREALKSAQAQLAETAARQATEGEQLRAWVVKLSGLSSSVHSFQEDLQARCDRLARELKELDRREKSSWERFVLDCR